jgi:hypothetical protein
MSDIPITIKNFFEYDGEGTVKFDNDEQVMRVKFNLLLLYNGKITGQLNFDKQYTSLLSFLKEVREFTLDGVIKISDKKFRLIAERCVLGSHKSSVLDSYSHPESRFSAHNVLFSNESMNMDKKPTGEFLIEFGLVNVYETFRVIVDTSIGTIYLQHLESIRELNRIMLTYHIPLITSVAKLEMKPDGTKTLQEILNNITPVIEDFLKITSLSQSVWHEWAYIRIIEKFGNSDQRNLVFQRFRQPKSKVPALRQLTNDSYSGEFIRLAWKGYSKELDEKYGFTFALEWYIESNVVDALEFKVLNASTCLELLMDKFSSEQKSEYIMDPEISDKFRGRLQKCVKKELKELEIGEEVRKSIYGNLGGISRRSYVNKAHDLLMYWGISYDDADMGFEDIVKVRDQITHRGKYYSVDIDTEFENVFKAYKSLALILPRIFLAMLKYKGQYLDTISDKWIQFEEVCNRP